ncbi:PREDICTED: leucine-rich repeat-containing protein 4C-like [Branchiostoma belcheri]|uniref:Leucine-rich repeat-containing protein 4C-like n=1 Tax=Branchiostoma belcheri TaxID=7741 RepID=A0A6P4ZK56_BRABE|nr:PREDICTED: leucine-rich repeat-containing protein 4C-like [Branchiostoma belcheri]
MGVNFHNISIEDSYCIMGKKPAGVLMFLLVILKVLGTIEAACSCTASACDCSSLGLTSVPQDLPTNITNLNLAGNQIITLSQSDFSRYRNVETLGLSSNHISAINRQAFYNLSKLGRLRLSVNRITTLRPDMFTGLGNLQTLELHYNDITDIPAGTFNSTPQLRDLYLDINRFNFTTLRSDMFTCLGNLMFLHLTSNGITDIQAGTFSPTPQLRWLLMQNNKLTTLRSDMFTGLGNLQVLKMSDNNITTFPFEELSRLQRLYRLYLDNNQMTTLPSVAYNVLTTISDVDINNNPWKCDCRMMDFRLKMTGFYPFENQINCSHPDHLSGLKLTDINPENLFTNCQEPTVLRFEKSKDNILVPGGTLYLIYEATGIPTPDITVILPSGLNATVESSGRVTVDVNDVNGTFTITNVTAVDAGLYVCIAVNLAGSTFATLVVDLHTVPTTVLPPLQTPPLATTSGNQESTTDQDPAQASFSPPVSVASSPLKQPEPAPTFSLPVLLGAVCGSVAGTLFIGGIVLAIWCKRSNNQGSPKRPDFSVVFNNTNTTTTVITNGHNLTGQTQPQPTRPPSSQFEPYEEVQPPQRGAVMMQTARGLSLDARNPHLFPRQPSSQFEPYEDVQPPQRGVVPSQTARGQALRPPNRSNNEPPPVPPPRTASATGYENIPEHAYQPLAVTWNQPDNGQDASHHYQSLRRT